MKKTNKKIWIAVLSILFMCTAFVLSNPNCPTGYSTAPGLNSTTTRNCTSCHNGNTLNSTGGSVIATGLPSSYVPGQTYPFSIKVTHASANRLVWGFSIKAVDTLTHAVVGTWSTANTNTSIKGTPTIANGNYELSHAQAITTAAANTATYTNLNWIAPSVPAAVQARVKFYICAVAGNGSGDETGDFVYTNSYTANQYVAPPACTFTYGPWTTCSNGTQTRSYTSSPAGCTGTPPADSIQRSCTVPCTFTYSAWTTCSNGTQTRTYTSSPAGCTGTPPADSLTRSCTVPCTFTYSAWSACNNGIQTRTYTSSPSGWCTGTPPADSLQRTCTASSLPTPVTITSTVTPGSCDTIRTFTVQDQTNVFYAWAISGTGNYITSGQGTSSIAAVIKVAGSATVSLSNSAGSIPATSLAFTKALPPTPTAINGSISPCPGTTVTYTLTNPVPTATQVAPIRFRWTKPLNTTIVSANLDSSSINLSFNTGYVGGTLSAKGESSCGIFGVAKSIAFSPAKVVDIVSSTGFWNACIGTSVNYIVISPVASPTLPVSSFRWTIPASTTIIAANADSSSITLQFNTGYRGGALSAKSATSCGALGTAVTKTLTHLNCAAGTRGMAAEILTTDLVNLFPNPNNGTFTLNIEAADKTNQSVSIQIMDIYGRVLGNYTTQSSNGIISKNITNNSLQTGYYIVTYTIGKVRKSVRMVVRK